MGKINEQDKEDKRRVEEYKKSPMINLADSINRSMVGDISRLTKGGCLIRIITIAIFIGILYFIFRPSN